MEKQKQKEEQEKKLLEQRAQFIEKTKSILVFEPIVEEKPKKGGKGVSHHLHLFGDGTLSVVFLSMEAITIPGWCVRSCLRCIVWNIHFILCSPVASKCSDTGLCCPRERLSESCTFHHHFDVVQVDIES